MAAVVARRKRGFTHEIEIGEHVVVADEPLDVGGDDRGPSPTRLLAGALAACVAITTEMYADRKGWDVGELEVSVDYELGREGSSFEVTLRLPSHLDAEQVERLRTIAGRCPVGRVIKGENSLAERVELTG